MSETGWQVECHDCPTVAGWYGERVRGGRKFDGPDAKACAEAWSLLHQDEEPGHTTRISHYTTVTFTADAINPVAQRIIFGHE